MLLIRCPWCGARDEVEFGYGGAAGVPYPADPDALTDAEWAEYVFVRDNPKGPFAERWVHSAGLSALVRRGAGHGDPRVPGGAVRLPTGGRLDRSTPAAVHCGRGDPHGLPRRHARVGAARRTGSGRSAPSAYLGRPRGIVAAGVEEPNALVQVGGRADAAGDDGRAGRRAGRRDAVRPGPSLPNRTGDGTTRSTCTATCWWSGADRPDSPPRRRRPVRRPGDPRRRAARAGRLAAVHTGRRGVPELPDGTPGARRGPRCSATTTTTT